MRRCSQGESSVPTAPAYPLLRLSTVRERSPVISRLIVLPASESQGAHYSLWSTRVCSLMLLSRAVPRCPATCCERIQVGRRLTNQWPLNDHLQNIELSQYSSILWRLYSISICGRGALFAGPFLVNVQYELYFGVVEVYSYCFRFSTPCSAFRPCPQVLLPCRRHHHRRAPGLHLQALSLPEHLMVVGSI